MKDKQWPSSECVSLLKLKPFAFIIIDNIYILKHFMITGICIIIKMHCKHLLQMQNLNGS